MNYIYLYFFTLIITFSTIGYGFILSKIIDKNLLRYNLGYIGLLGLLCLVIISYTTIYFTKHGYIHNIILHAFGIFSFIFHIKERKLNIDVVKLVILFSVLFCGLLVIRNHDDFNYYHFTYSLGLTENKLFLGLGNFQHGYKHHSSIFFLNSITFLPFIKYFLFHSISWITLVFINYIILDFVLKNNNLKKFDFNLIFYITVLLFINYKFFRIGSHGTDISGQLILLILLPFVYSSLKQKKINSDLDMVILLITYVVTLKAFFVLNFIFLFAYVFVFKIKKLLNYILNTKTILISFLTIALLSSINISYTGCVIYPIKQTCFFDKFSWTIKKQHVEHLSQWYEVWAKSGAGPNYGADNLNEYVKNFNWVSNWYKRYFEYKGLETIGGILLLFILMFTIYYNKNRKPPKKNEKKIIVILYLLSLILLFEWFINRPTLRYGGYYLLCFTFFIFFSYFLSFRKIKFEKIKKYTTSLIIISFLLFNFKNISRIMTETEIVKEHNFPLFYAPIQTFKTIKLKNNVEVYIPNNTAKAQGCWVTKTPCVNGVDHIRVKQKYGFTIFYNKT